MKYSKTLAVVISLSIFLLNFELTVETEVTAIEKVSSDSYLSEFFELSVDEIKEKIGDIESSKIIIVINNKQLGKIISELENQKNEIGSDYIKFKAAFWDLLLDKLHLSGIYNILNPLYVDTLDLPRKWWNKSDMFHVEEDNNPYSHCMLSIGLSSPIHPLYYGGKEVPITSEEAVLRELYVIETYGDKEYFKDVFVGMVALSDLLNSDEKKDTLTTDLGDINADGNVDLTDLSELSLTIIGDKTLTERQIKVADINGNGEADLPDLARLRQYLSKVIDSLESELKLVDIKLMNNASLADAEETFYKDEKYEYVFPSIESDYIECTFSDGSKLKIKEALEKGLVTVKDLNTYNIMYWMIDSDGNAISSLESVSKNQSDNSKVIWKTSQPASVNINEKEIAYSLYEALNNEQNKGCLFAVTPVFKIDNQFEYNGKTIAQYEEESDAEYQYYLQIGELIKIGDSLKYGEALYTTGTPEGEKWAKELYDNTIERLGKDLISKYIIDGEFFREEAEKVWNNQPTVCYDALITARMEYQKHMNEETVKKLSEQNIEYEFNNKDQLIIFITSEEFKSLNLENVQQYMLATNDTIDFVDD